MAAGVGAMLGIKGIGKAMIGTNSELEQAKIQLAGMMAISRKSTLAKEMDEASRAVDRLNERAIELPGSTMDYIKVMKQAAFPILKAGASMQDLEDITVATMAAMKVKDVDAGTASRSLMRIFQGNALSRDRVTQFFAELLGMSVKELNVLGKTNKQLLLAKVLTASRKKEVSDLLDAQNKSFKGQTEELSERIQRVLQRIGAGMFKSLGKTLTEINEWFKKNRKEVEAWADNVGLYVEGTFEKIKKAVNFLRGDTEGAKVAWAGIAVIIGTHVVRAVRALMLALMPLGKFFLVATAIVYAIMRAFDLTPQDLLDGLQSVIEAIAEVIEWFAGFPDDIEGSLQKAADKIKDILGRAWDWVKSKGDWALGLIDDNEWLRTAVQLAGSGQLLDKETIGQVKRGESIVGRNAVNSAIGIGSQAEAVGGTGVPTHSVQAAPHAFTTNVGPTTITINVANANDAKKVADDFRDDEAQRRAAYDNFHAANKGRR